MGNSSFWDDLNSSCSNAVNSCYLENSMRFNFTLQEQAADFYVVLPVIYSVICAVGLTGNTAVIYVILKAPKMKTVTNMFILNLAIADDLFTLVLPMNIAEHLLRYWPFGEIL